jgi:hypothetical protein
MGAVESKTAREGEKASRHANALVFYMAAIQANKLLLNGWFKIIAAINLKV